MASIKDFNWREDAPLALCKYESKLSNKVLLAYAALGTLRPSLESFYHAYISEHSRSPEFKKFQECTLRGWSMDFRWMARLDRYDQLVEEKRAAEFAQLARDDKDVRIKMLQAYRGKITQAMQLLDPSACDWQALTAAMRMVTEQLRREFDLSEKDGELEPPVLKRGRPSSAESQLRDAIRDMSDAELEEALANIDAVIP